MNEEEYKGKYDRFLIFLIFIYLAAPGVSLQHAGSFHYGMQTLRGIWDLLP